MNIQGLFPLGLTGLFDIITFEDQLSSFRASLVAQRLKHLPGMWETLGQEDTLEKEMATHSSTLARRIPWREELVGYSPRGRKELDTTQRLHFHFLFKFSFIMIDLPNN